MWRILLLITVLMGCATAIIATVTKFDVSPMADALIFLVMATFFTAMFENS